MKKWNKEVTVIVAPKEPVSVVLLPGIGLTLLDRPKNPGFKAWVKGDPIVNVERQQEEAV